MIQPHVLNSAKPQDALDRAQEMMFIPMNQLPSIAVDYARHLGANGGICAEVLLTAWAHYAQAVEGLKTDDEAYRAGAWEREWFANQGVTE